MTLEELKQSSRAVITVTDVAAVLEVDERTVRRACLDAQLPCVRVGKRLLVPREKFLALICAPGVPDADDAPT